MECGQGLAVGRKRQGVHSATTTLQRDLFFSRGHVPQFHFEYRFVPLPAFGGRSQGLAVGRKRDLENGGPHVRLALQRVQLLAGGDVPQFDGLARTRPGQNLAVRREGHVMRVTARRFDDDSGFLHLDRLLRQRAGIGTELDRRRRCLYDWWSLCQRSIKSSRAQADCDNDEQHGRGDFQFGQEHGVYQPFC